MGVRENRYLYALRHPRVVAFKEQALSYVPSPSIKRAPRMEGADRFPGTFPRSRIGYRKHGRLITLTQARHPLLSYT